MKIKIPFETANDRSNVTLIPSIEFFRENREHQMKYTKKAVESGVYGEWIRQLETDEIKAFVKQNYTKLENALKHKMYGPKFHEKYFWRNVVYKHELLLREHEGEIELDTLETWTESVLNEHELWKERFKAATAEWKRSNGIFDDPSSSSDSLYY